MELQHHQESLTEPLEKNGALERPLLPWGSLPPQEDKHQGLPQYCDRLTADHSFVAASVPMLQIRQEILRIAPMELPVFISGESGAGKEVVARMIHARSSRSAGPFVRVNCAALTGELLETELFGYEQDKQTGPARPNYFELAQGGTIFLDEIVEMSPHAQMKLLQVLQDHQYSRQGGRSLIETDVRVLAASKVHMPDAIHAGRLRKDLYFRLNVMEIRVPPLRERSVEVPLLFAHFLEKYAKQFQRDPRMPDGLLLDVAMRYSWPGNLHELENFVKRYVILNNQADGLQELAKRAGPLQPLRLRGRGLKEKIRNLKNQMESEAISGALEQTHWYCKGAAATLGISYKTLLYKMHKFNLGSGRGFRSAAARRNRSAN